jgi:heme exporter protein B
MSLFQTIRRLVGRDLARAFARPADLLLPPAFFLLVAILFAFALGADGLLLSRAATAILWVAALLASLLPVATLYAADEADGTLDQLTVRGIAAETLALARIISSSLLLGLPLLVALAPAFLLLGVPIEEAPRLAGALLLGSLGLAALANIMGALTLGARGGGGLVAILVVPVALPILIFGSGLGAAGALRLLAASVLLLLALAPFATAMALRLARG